MSGSMKRVDPLSEVLDDIEDDPDIDEQRIVWEKVTEFRAAVSHGTVDREGQLSLTLKVPYEDKYLALPVTDIRGVLMVFGVFKPMQTDNSNLDDEG
jgi:hypothetical protein